MALTPGTRLGVYEVTAQIGEGGMGQVYRATDTKLKRQVAIKILPPSLAADHERLARFQREAEVLASLNHPNIAVIYGLEESGGVSALVMELVEGSDLSQRIARGAILLDEALPIAKQIADALEAAHEQGIVHRDLKPANIKIRDDGMVKVLDFGLARAMEPAARSSPSLSMSPTITTPAMTQAGMILGTAAYMSPEQARGTTADKRVDLWAFGVVLWEMLTGKRLFEGATVSDTLAAVLKTEPAWSALASATPPAIRRLLRRCLEKDRRRRLDSAAAARLDIEEAITTPSTLDGAAPPDLAARRGERLAWMTALAVAAVVIIVLAIPATRYLRESRPDPFATRFDFVTPPTTEPFSFALSPDGRQIVFVAVAEGGSKLWLRLLDQTAARPIAGTERASAPFWAPDGRALGFFADAKLKRIDLAGGAPQVLADAPAVRGGTWNRADVIVFASGTTGLRQVAAAGGTATELTRSGRGQAAHWWPQFLPDGRRFLFYAPGPPDTQGVYLGSLDGGDPTRVLAADTAAAYAPPGYLLLVAQGALVARRFDAARGIVSGEQLPVALAVGSDANNRAAFAVSAADVLAHRSGLAGRRQLVWVDRAGKTMGVLLPPEDTGLSYVELAPDGRQVAVLRIVQGNNDVWVIEVARGLTSRFTSDPANDSAPVWSPDGSRLVFRSSRNGHYDLFEKAANGAADERPLLVTQQDKMPQGVSPDGRFLLYAVQDSKTQSDLWALPLVGDRTPFPVVQTSFDEVHGQFSPDGHWVAYASNDSGRYEVYVRPFPPAGGKWQVSTDGGIYPRWRRDGRELFYVAPDNRMMAAPIHFVADGRTPSPGAAVALFPTRLTTGNVGIGGYSSRAQYAVAADGRFLLNVSADDASASPITVVLNWTAGLKR